MRKLYFVLVLHYKRISLKLDRSLVISYQCTYMNYHNGCRIWSKIFEPFLSTEITVCIEKVLLHLKIFLFCFLGTDDCFFMELCYFLFSLPAYYRLLSLHIPLVSFPYFFFNLRHKYNVIIYIYQYISSTCWNKKVIGGRIKE